MSHPPTPDRSELTSGEVYRRIPRDYVLANGQIRYEAFRPREQDRGGLSVDLDLNTAIANLRSLKGQKREFLLAALDVSKIRTGTVAWVSAPSNPGVSHTRIENCANIDTQQALADIAKIVPVPPEP